MFSTVIFLVFIIFKAAASDPANDAVILTANRRNLAYVKANLSVNYDGEARYTYVEGEDLEISCKRADLGIPSTLRLEYYNAKDILLFQTKSREYDPHLFQIILKSNNNNYYLDCIRTVENPRREYRYRTTFLENKGDLQAGGEQRALTWFVNRQELTTYSKNKYLSFYDDYIFRYIDGDVLNITCQKYDNTVRGILRFDFSDYITMGQIRSPSQAVITINISTRNLDGGCVICGINNTHVLKSNARLLFLNDILRNEIRIMGLPRNNILYQYTNEDYHWTIEYQYSVNETLNLTCESSDEFHGRRPTTDFFRWTFEGKSYDSPTEHLPTYRLKFSQQTFTMILDATHNTTKLLCIYYPLGKHDFQTSVELIFRLISEENQIVSVESSTNKDILIYSLSSVLVVAVCSIIVIIIILYKRSSIQELALPTPRPDPASVYYENTLSVFAPINEREAEAMENHYEEIQ